ncbi:MAG: hypothetical protein QCH99_09195 [Candidatus Bathyarchaeota archaeon]|nr:hypothetical protein [Candidatus Bathyarchaeum tardum]WGM90042.1 MAG: hypothetical protein NUK63_02680 [Candidatus Bathyarchaeum tardum]
MRAIDAKILEELDMLYDDKDCFASLDSWLGNAEKYMTNLNRLFLVANHAKQQYLSETNAITGYCTRIIKLFNQTKSYASGWNSKQNGQNRTFTEKYIRASEESWNTLNQWTESQIKLRDEILKLVEFLYTVGSK